jgi:hypothetical protein
MRHQNSSCPGRSAKRVFTLDVPAIHVLTAEPQRKTWMAGTKPGHDEELLHIRRGGYRSHRIAFAE